MKATLARGHSSHRKVPPITPDRSAPGDDDIYVESARDSVLDGLIDDIEDDYNVSFTRPLKIRTRESFLRKNIVVVSFLAHLWCSYAIPLASSVVSCLCRL